MKKLLFVLSFAIVSIAVYAQPRPLTGVGNAWSRVTAGTINLNIDRTNDNAAVIYDTTLFTTFFYGHGLPGDTIYSNIAYNSYGYEKVLSKQDMLYIETWISSGDSINFSLVYNDTLWSTTNCDTLCTIAAGGGKTTTTTFNVDYLSLGDYLWMEHDTAIATKKPIKFRSKVYTKLNYTE